MQLTLPSNLHSQVTKTHKFDTFRKKHLKVNNMAKFKSSIFLKIVTQTVLNCAFCECHGFSFPVKYQNLKFQWELEGPCSPLNFSKSDWLKLIM